VATWSPSTKRVAVPPFAEPAAVIGELHAQLVLADIEWLLGGDGGALQAEEAVVVGRAAVLEGEHPAAGHAALVDDHPARVLVGDDQLGGDRMRLVLDAEDGVLGWLFVRSLEADA
jgi:hypothetical protein